MRQTSDPQQNADDGEVAAYLGTINDPPPNMNAATLKARQEAFMSMVQPGLDDIEAGRARDLLEVLDEIRAELLARHEQPGSGAA